MSEGCCIPTWLMTQPMKTGCYSVFNFRSFFPFKLHRIKGGLFNQDQDFVLLGFQEAVVIFRHGVVLRRYRGTERGSWLLLDFS